MIANKQRRFFLAPLLATLLMAGCAETIAPTALDPSKAREALKTTLETWKKGDAPDTLKTASPAITAQDLDWLSGAKLVDYQIKDDGKGIDSNLKVPVQLTMKSKDGKDVVKNVHYLVTTSPSLTVFRSFP